MKKVLLTAFVAMAITNTNAQVVNDTVSTGNLYANQVWYSMANDEQGSAPKNNWDIAFDASGFGSTIMVNTVIGDSLWIYPKSDGSGWGSVDTSGLSTWAPRWNAATSWTGAMGNYADPANSSDLDWGLYNVTTHVITGDSLYIIKLSGGSYKKLMIESLAGGTYTFKYANLDGSDLQNATLIKSAYGDRNFGYYSLQTNAALNREPATANWDLVFTQYTAFIPTAYTVTGVLSNNGVEVAKCANLPDKATFTNYATATFSQNINVVGYNWKTFTGMAYSIQDSVVFFVKPGNGDIWKMIFTGFSGSGTGSFMFSKQKLYTNTSGVADVAIPSLALYPNPASGQAVNVIYSFNAATTIGRITVTDIAGRTVLTDDLTTKGLGQYLIDTRTLHTGMYIVTITDGTSINQQKLIVQ